MARINKEEYQLLKELENRDFKWLAKDRDKTLIASQSRPSKTDEMWRDERTRFCFNYKDSQLFQFIQWEDEEPYNIAELIEEYEKDYKGSWEHAIEFSKEVRRESEETEVKTLESIREEIWEEMLRLEDQRKDQWADIKYQTLREVLQKLGHLDEPEPKNITLQDVTDKLWELPLNSRKLWLARLNDEFQEGYIVPLGLKTTDGEEQYLTYNGSYFASRRNKYLQQTFDTLEEIPEFYRGLAERVL